MPARYFALWLSRRLIRYGVGLAVAWWVGTVWGNGSWAWDWIVFRCLVWWLWFWVICMVEQFLWIGWKWADWYRLGWDADAGVLGSLFQEH